jgi:transposase InsO family protein
VDAGRSRRELILENAVLRHQIGVLLRGRPRPRLRGRDRIGLVLAATLLPAWRRVVALVQPDTILRWHRQGFRLFWRRKTVARRSFPGRRLAADTVALIREMAEKNRIWGAERIRGELLKLGICVSKRTVQKYMAAVRRRPGGQSWATFLRNHVHETWACDFLQTYDLWFRPVFALVFIALGSRRVVHVAATRAPSQAWTAQQMRNATMDGEGPRFLLRDHDDKYGAAFDRAAHGCGARVIQIVPGAPDMNAICERFLRSARQECLDHCLIHDDRHLGRLLEEYRRFHNAARPHQGIGQRIPDGTVASAPAQGRVVGVPVLGGLHHDYRRAA